MTFGGIPTAWALEAVPGLTLARAWAQASGLVLIEPDLGGGTWEVWKPATGHASATLLGLGSTPVEAAHDARATAEGA